MLHYANVAAHAATFIKPQFSPRNSTDTTSPPNPRSPRHHARTKSARSFQNHSGYDVSHLHLITLNVYVICLYFLIIRPYNEFKLLLILTLLLLFLNNAARMVR